MLFTTAILRTKPAVCTLVAASIAMLVASCCGPKDNGVAETKNPVARPLSPSVRDLILSFKDGFNAYVVAAPKLIDRRDESLPALIDALQSSDEHTVIYSIWILGSMGDRRAIAPLVAIADRHPKARYTRDIARQGGAAVQSLYARAAVVTILDVDARSREVGVADVDSPAFDRVIDYHNWVHGRYTQLRDGWRNR